DNDNLQNLNGLETLSILTGGVLIIENNTSLSSIISLNNMPFDRATIKDNPLLNSLEGINVSNASRLYIINNDALVALPTVTGILKRELIIQDNSSLNDLSGFQNVVIGPFTVIIMGELSVL